MRLVLCLALAVALGAGLVFTTLAQPPGGGKDDAEIVQAFDKLAKAFNAADAKGVAAVWSEKGEYISDDNGERH